MHGCNGDSVSTVCDSFMTLLVLVYSDFEGALVALHNEWCLSSNERVFESSDVGLPSDYPTVRIPGSRQDCKGPRKAQ